MMGNVVSAYPTLRAITPVEALHEALATESNIDPRDRAGWLSDSGSDWAGLVEGGQISASAFSSTCATQPAANVNLFQTASGLALGTTSAGVGILAANPALLPMISVPVAGAIIAAAGVVIAIIDTILNHHATAVRQEQHLGCAAISAFNNAMSLIDQGVQSGRISPDAAEGALDHLESQVESYMAASIKHNPCNADCEVLLQVKAIVNYKKSEYADLAAGAISPAQQSNTVAAPPSPMNSPSGLITSRDGKPGLAQPPGGYPSGFVPTCGSNRPGGIWNPPLPGSCEDALQAIATTGPVMPAPQYSGGPAPRVSVMPAAAASAGGWFEQNKWLLLGGLALFLVMEPR